MNLLQIYYDLMLLLYFIELVNSLLCVLLCGTKLIQFISGLEDSVVQKEAHSSTIPPQRIVWHTNYLHKTIINDATYND